MMALYAANTSVLVVSPLSMLLPKNASVLDFGVGPITSFRLIDTEDGTLYGVLLQTGPKSAPTAWYWARIDIARYDEDYSVGHVSRLNDLYPAGVNIFDVNFYVEKYQVTLVISTSLASAPNFNIDFVSISGSSEPVMKTISRVGVSFAGMPDSYTPTPLKVTTFMQAGAMKSVNNRTLITLRDEHYVHVIGTPNSVNDASPETFTLEWFNPFAQTLTLYAPAPKRLFHATFFSELELRDGAEVPYVWLAHVIDEPESDGQSSSTLTTTLFPEFGYSWTEIIAPLPQQQEPSNLNPTDETNPTDEKIPFADPIPVPDEKIPFADPIPVPDEKIPFADPIPAPAKRASRASSASKPIASYSMVSVVNPLGLIGSPCRWNMNMNFTGDCSESRPFKTLESRVGSGIRQIEVRSIPKVAWLADFFPPDFSLRNWTTLAVNVIFSIESTTLRVYAMDEKIGTQYDVRVEEMNHFEMLGTAHRLEVSQNGLHALPIVEKHAWELESMDRYNTICEKLEDPSHLTPFELQVRHAFF